MAYACGARFSETLYVKTEFDPETSECTVTVKTEDSGVPVVKTGTVTLTTGE